MPAMEPEQNAKHRLNVQLVNLGWTLDGPDKNVYFEGECKTAEQKQKLRGQLPDYILYRPGTLSPLAVLEAKRPRKKLDAALQQGQEYARRLGVNIVFASDGRITRTCTAAGEPLLLDSRKVDDLLPPHLTARLAANANIGTSALVIKNRKALIKIFSDAEKILRNNGIDAGMQSVYEFCIILFIKINSELKNDGKWAALCNATDKNILAVYENIVNDYKKKYPGIFRETNITDARVMQKIVSTLVDINLIDTDIDVKGEAYEFFLKRYSRENKSVLGQHFTPRHITDMMTIMLDPAAEEKIYDPFCGTGGMLLSCYKYIRKNIASLSALKALNSRTLFGSDIGYGTSQLAKMNMIIIGDGSSNISNQDSLAHPVRQQYDKVITNIPFNLKGAFPGHLYGSRHTNGNVVCLLHCLHAARVGGSACIIVPENFCYDASYAEARRDILSMAKLSALIRLPRATFKSYTTARTCILYFTEIGRGVTAAYRYIVIEQDGFSDSTWREPVDENDIEELLENWQTLSAYPAIRAEEHGLFPPQKDVSFKQAKDFWRLRDVLQLKTPLQLEPNRRYNEPKLCSHTNTIRARGAARYGRNIRNSKKVLIEPGDLVIATLHTNSGNGLFAVSEDTYVATSQIVARVNEQRIDKIFLVAVLKHILPQLEVKDLVGRETFREEDILNLKIPKQPPFFSSEEYKKLLLNWQQANNTLQTAITREINQLF